MTIFGGYTPSVNSISGSSYKAEPDTSALQSSTGISVSPSSSDNAKGEPATPAKVAPDTPSEPASQGGGISIALPAFDDSGTPHWEEHKVEPEKAEPANTVNVPLPTFDESGKATGFKDNEVEIPQEQQHLDLSKLDLTPTVTHVYQHEDGSLGWEPDNRGTLDNLAPKSTAPKEKKQTATAALPEVSQMYKKEKDDYSFDTNDFSTNRLGMSVTGGGDSSGKHNSNVNDAIFGGQSNRATPGYSLW